MQARVLLAQGREAEVFLQSDGTVLKLMREESYGPRVEREAAALRTLSRLGHPVPRLFDTVVVDGRPGLVVERVAGEDLLARLGRRPLSLLAAGRVLGEAHAAMHEVVAPAELPDLNDELRGRIASAPDLPEALRATALSILASLPSGDRLCHGDLHIGNMLGTWKSWVVIDWGDASRGDPMADVARTAVLQRLGELPPGAPGVIRLVAPIGRDILVSRYLRAYRKRRPIDGPLLARWEIVRAAARFSEAIPSEHPALIAFIGRRLEEI